MTGESRILLHRNIHDRVRTIAPFLQLDRDPYVVISDGRLYWMPDAYTTSRWFPYAQPQPDGETNYIAIRSRWSSMPTMGRRRSTW